MKILIILLLAVLFAAPALARNVGCPCFDTESIRQLVEDNGTEPSRCITDNDSLAYIWYISDEGWFGAIASRDADVKYSCEFSPTIDTGENEIAITHLEIRQCIKNLRYGVSSCDFD